MQVNIIGNKSTPYVMHTTSPWEMESTGSKGPTPINTIYFIFIVAKESTPIVLQAYKYCWM